MKKIAPFSLTLSLIAVLLCGLSACKKPETSLTPVTKGISFSCSLTYYNECYEGNAQIDDDGVMALTLTAPASLDGLAFVFDGDNATATYKGLSYGYRLSSVPEGMAVSTLYQILRDTFDPEAQVILQDDLYCMTGKTASADYRIVFGQTGLPISASAPETGFTVSFQNVTID